MEITLPKAVLDELPAPDQNGLVRVTAALRVTDGKAELVELNDTPMPGEDDMPDEPEEMPEPAAVAAETQY